jgi:phosphatidylglycerophosphate synthase
MKAGNRANLLFVTFLTFARFPLVLLFFVGAIAYAARDRQPAWLFGLSFFALVASAVTDFFDGYFARRLKVVTKLGAHADPLMDKFFYLASLPLLVFVAARNEHFRNAAFLLVLAILFLLRDQWVTFLRSIGSMYSVSGAADWSGKLRTAINFPLICAIYYFEEAPATVPWLPRIPSVPLRVFEGIGMLVTLVSIYTYTRRYWPYLRQAAEISHAPAADASAPAPAPLAPPAVPQDDATPRSLFLMATGVAHDFNNLLASILGNAEVTLRSLPDDSPAKPHAREIHDTAVASLDLADQIMVCAGKGNFTFAPLNLAQFLAETRAEIRAAVPTPIAVEFGLPGGLPLVNADKAYLRRALMNLVSNAADSIQQETGGRIRVAVTAGGPAADREPGVLALEVQDNGCGMAPEVRARAMDPFFTTRIRGRGLGLSVVRGVAMAHGGTLSLDTEPGRGTRARILLPAVR